MTLHARIDRLWRKGITVFEKVVAFAVVVGVVTYAIGTASVMIHMNWTETETFYKLIHNVLAIIIGLELVRMLVSHSISAVLELLAFVISRKMLNPDLSSLDIMLGVVAFVALMAARHYFTEAQFLHEKDEDHEHDEKKSRRK